MNRPTVHHVLHPTSWPIPDICHMHHIGCLVSGVWCLVSKYQENPACQPIPDICLFLTPEVPVVPETNIRYGDKYQVWASHPTTFATFYRKCISAYRIVFSLCFIIDHWIRWLEISTNKSIILLALWNFTHVEIILHKCRL